MIKLAIISTIKFNYKENLCYFFQLIGALKSISFTFYYPRILATIPPIPVSSVAAIINNSR